MASLVLPAQTFLEVRFLNLKAALALSCTDVATPGRGRVALGPEGWAPCGQLCSRPKGGAGNPPFLEGITPLVNQLLL